MTEDQRYIVDSLTERIILSLIGEFSLPVKSALRFVYGSETFGRLCDVESGEYMNGTVGVYADLREEYLKGAAPKEY